MKSFRLLAIPLLVLTQAFQAAVVDREIIRDAGQYLLDALGSMLTIEKQPAGFPSVTATWLSSNATSSASLSIRPANCIRADGWFVFVEQPQRLWIFDGVDEAILLSRADRETGAKAFPRAALGDCPKKFWDTLPSNLRAKYPKLEPATGAKPDRPTPAAD